MDKEHDISELIASVHEGVDTLESLIRTGRVPDGVPNDYTAMITSESYDEGYRYGYREHMHDIFVPMLVSCVVCGAGGILIGMAVV